ncbi:ASCH domain-containing protein [Clostridium perfringens]|uniref:ASCH domain-containing protein n=1 Tax=Clostridium perfringens TaxID=1502 RepID=UPI0013E3735F|nr:ASCH domain-containing protein [Clostridium perfringens]MCX0383598.1 ASCH domain-containing protein [Clostridium perfringens]MCX0413682.1 ASCH domain-containing protein [Clostridium perfringens]MDU7844695.1 ASCH domain-containing protein [Clostridium perfringens]NGT03767.1 ASCH domain-containing protein [Clostridium perfringens]
MKRHVMNLSPDSFEMIEIGTKTIEMRLYDEKRKKISKGDYINFISTMNNKKQLEVKVIEIYKYNNFEELYKEFNKVKLGYREDEIAHYTDMEQYYSKEDIAKYGVIGIELEVKNILRL